MLIKFVQLNNSFKADNSAKNNGTYRDVKKPVGTRKRVKPLPPKGHLVDDNPKSKIKYFFKDIGYDLKSVKNGYIGTANDHQLGRLNDVGLRLGGIGIATYLASQTTNPKTRLMEYIGLATFLTAMSVYPKLAINLPAKALNGFDISKEYIDDQGRKKSVFQDSNYIPYDMYDSKNKEEDLDTIGDKLGIPRDIKDRHEIVREQMRKIATQNNTLWMLTAGFATPLLTALFCSGVEKFVVQPGLEDYRNAKNSFRIKNLLNQIKLEQTDSFKTNNYLGDSVKSIVSKYEGKTFPKEEAEKLVAILTQDTDTFLGYGIKKDAEKLLSGSEAVYLDEKILNKMFSNAGNAMQGRQTKFIFENIIPNTEEINGIIKEIKPDCDISKGVELTAGEFEFIRNNILKRAENAINKTTGAAASHKEYLNSNVLQFMDAFTAEKKYVITKESSEKLIKFANIIGDFKKKSEILDKCENFKFEHTPESVLANYYEKFEKILVKQLGISPKDYKRMSNDKEFTYKILDEKFSELCKNEKKYKETFEKLAKVMSDMETALHGSAEETSQINDLINGIETVYGRTAKLLTENGIGKSTADILVKGDFSGSVSGREELNNLLDGITENKYKYSNPYDIEGIKEISKGKGSLKNLKISRLVNRYQGEVNSFRRIMHTLDFYKRAQNPQELMKYSGCKDLNYIQNVEYKVKKAMLDGSISDYIMKHGIDNVNEYRDFYNIGWPTEVEHYGSTMQKGIITGSAKEGLQKHNKNNILERFQTYITRFKNILANDKTDFTRPNHVLDENIVRNYTDMARTNESKFNLVGQSPIDMFGKAAEKMHADRIWVKKVGIAAGVVLSITLLSQFCFKKIRINNNLHYQNNNKSEKQKQVKHEQNK